MDAKVTFRFVGLLDRLSHPLDGAREALKGRLDGFEAESNAFEEFCVGVCF
jgi:hypothetical protein